MAVAPEYLCLADLAVYASVSKNTLKKWLTCGMPSYKVGRCVRVKRAEFDEWMQQFRHGTDSQDLEAIWAQVLEEVHR